MVLKAVIVGLGGHARGSWMHSLHRHKDYKIIGVVDTDTELLQNVPQILPELGEDQVYRTIQEAVKYGEKPDLAVIATPIPTHHVIFQDAMKLGINCICEKNLASTIYQGRQMLQCALDHPELTTAVGVQRRYSGSHWVAKKYLQLPDNKIGKLSHIRWADAFPWGLYRDGWRQFLPELFAEDQMIHWFDLMHYITGLDIVQVYADSYLQNWSDWCGASSIMANLALAHPDDYHHRHNWVWAQFYGDWQRKGPALTINEFSGEKGRFEFDNWGLKISEYKDELGHKIEEDGFLAADAGPIEGIECPYDGQSFILEMMKRGIESKGKIQPSNKIADVFKSFAAVMGAIDSSHSGKAIYVPDYWKDMSI